MPKYEIGYILSSGVSDDEVPKVASSILEQIEKLGGKILKEDHWGRKKLAYPIGRTRNGYYVFVLSDMPSEKIQDLEHLFRTNDSIIRFLIVNMADADKRKARDEEIRARRKPSDRKPESTLLEQTPEESANLELEIDKAINIEENI